MRGSLLLASVIATARSALAKGPFLQQISSTQWVFGNDIWNLTQGPTYATNLQYQGSDAVKGAPGHYAGYGTEATTHYTLNMSLLTWIRWRKQPHLHLRQHRLK